MVPLGPAGFTGLKIECSVHIPVDYIAGKHKCKSLNKTINDQKSEQWSHIKLQCQ